MAHTVIFRSKPALNKGGKTYSKVRVVGEQIIRVSGKPDRASLAGEGTARSFTQQVLPAVKSCLEEGHKVEVHIYGVDTHGVVRLKFCEKLSGSCTSPKAHVSVRNFKPTKARVAKKKAGGIPAAPKRTAASKKRTAPKRTASKKRTAPKRSAAKRGLSPKSQAGLGIYQAFMRAARSKGLTFAQANSAWGVVKSKGGFRSEAAARAAGLKASPKGRPSRRSIPARPKRVAAAKTGKSPFKAIR